MTAQEARDITKEAEEFMTVRGNIEKFIREYARQGKSRVDLKLINVSPHRMPQLARDFRKDGFKAAVEGTNLLIQW